MRIRNFHASPCTHVELILMNLYRTFDITIGSHYRYRRGHTGLVNFTPRSIQMPSNLSLFSTENIAIRGLTWHSVDTSSSHQMQFPAMTSVLTSPIVLQDYSDFALKSCQTKKFQQRRRSHSNREHTA